MTATYIAECFWPGVTDELVEDAGLRASRAVAELRSEGKPISYVGSILVPEDEVVFFQFEGPSADIVREASGRAELPIERVVESVQGTSGERSKE
jgi:hypothetical protein